MTGPALDPDQVGFVPPTAEGRLAPEGTAVSEVEEIDSFSFTRTEVWHLPADKRQTMTIKVMNEGDKKKFQKDTQRDVTLERRSGNAKFSTDQAMERHSLITTSVVDWTFKRKGSAIPLGTSSTNKSNLKEWLEVTDPRNVEDLEKFIRKLNPWLLGDLTVEDIDEQIEELKETRADLIKRNAGEADSTSK